MKFTDIHVNTQREIFTYGVYVNIKIWKESFNHLCFANIKNNFFLIFFMKIFCSKM